MGDKRTGGRLSSGSRSESKSDNLAPFVVIGSQTLAVLRNILHLSDAAVSQGLLRFDRRPGKRVGCVALYNKRAKSKSTFLS